MGQIVDRRRLAGTELFEHERLCPREARAAFDGGRTLAQRRDEAAQGVEQPLPLPFSGSRHVRSEMHGLPYIWNHRVVNRRTRPFLVLARAAELVYRGPFLAAEVVAFAVLAPVYARDGWLIEYMVRDPRAPNGTLELTFCHAMRCVEHSHYATLGRAPLTGDVGAGLAAVRSLSGSLYDFRGLCAFKAKLLPARWTTFIWRFPQDKTL